MFLVKFCTVVVAETYETSWQLVDIIHYQCHAAKDYLKNHRAKINLKKSIKRANSYSEWKAHAEEYDRLKESHTWKETDGSSLYDWQYIDYLRGTLKESREKDDYMAVIHTIRSNATRNVGNILDPLLYSKSFVGTKSLIENFQREIITCFEYIANLPHNKLQKSQKLEFFAETRQAFGKTALVLSGGGGFGKYHYGVIKCLYEKELVPRVVAGSSIGSVFASLLCCKTPDEMDDMLTPEKLDFSAYKRREKFSLLKNLRCLFREGYLIDPRVGRDFMRANIGDLTFQEAYDKTGYILNITTTGYGPHDSCKLLNYLTAPTVLVWSAVCASCALPYVFGPVDLYCKNENGQIKLYLPENKKFVDGSISADVPMQQLSEMFNVNCFIVSQVNPWIVPFLKHSEHLRHSNLTFLHKIFEVIKDLISSEIKHRVGQLGKLGLFPKALSKYFNLVTQTYTGHVTIFPDPTLYDFWTLVDDPRPETMRQGLEAGAHRVYPKINHISAILDVEKSLEKNYQSIKTMLEKKISLDEAEESENDEQLEIEKGTIFTIEDLNKSLKLQNQSSFKIPRAFSFDLLKNISEKTFEYKPK